MGKNAVLEMKDRRLKAAVHTFLILHDCSIDQLAKMLGMGRSTLYYKLKNTGTFTFDEWRQLVKILSLQGEDLLAVI